MPGVDTVRMLFAYTDWASDLLLGLSQELPPERTPERTGAGHGSITATFVHVLQAEIVWLNRWLERGWVDLPPAESYDLAAIRGSWAELRRERSSFLAALTPDPVAETIHYANAAGERFAQPLEHLVLQLVIHDAHHRSEIAEMLTEAGRAPPTTDLVVYLRQRLDQA